MKYWITLTMHIAAFTLFAQEAPKEKSPFYVGGFYSADYTKGGFDGAYGYNTGINLLRNISPKFRMDIGLHFSSIGERKENLTFGSSLNPATGAFDTTKTLRQKYQFIELPIKVNYFVAKSKRVNVFLLAGLAPNYFLRTRTAYDTYPPDGNKIEGETYTNKNKSYSTIGISGTIGFGVELNLTERLSLNFQPEYRYYFASTSLTAIGLNSGVIFRL